MRAISIKTDDVNDLGGFLFPGAKVDILVAIKSGANFAARSVVIVQDVSVLATGKQLTPDPEGKPTTVSIVTVLVTPEQAQKIALVQQESSISVSLRNGGDDERMVASKPALFSDISGEPTSPVTAKRPPDPQRQTSRWNHGRKPTWGGRSPGNSSATTYLSASTMRLHQPISPKPEAVHEGIECRSRRNAAHFISISGRSSANGY